MRVYLKTVEIGESLGIKPFKQRGGEAEVVSISEDKEGQPLYYVRLLKNGRQRIARREDLTVRRKQPKPRPEKGKRHAT